MMHRSAKMALSALRPQLTGAAMARPLASAAPSLQPILLAGKKSKGGKASKGDDDMGDASGGSDDTEDAIKATLANAAAEGGKPVPKASDGKAQLKPAEVVSELDKHIVGQKGAKRAVAIALRNRWRRLQLGEDMRDEVHPKNILMIGSTGVGKTEIGRRLAKLSQAPFVKVEATKFTEVGFHGRDVDKIIQDLVETSINLTKQMRLEAEMTSVESVVEEQILDMLTGKSSEQTRASFRELLRKGELDKHSITIDVAASGPGGGPFPISIEGQGNNPVHMNQVFAQIGKIIGGQKKEKKKMTIKEAQRVLADQEIENRMDAADTTKDAIELAEQHGIVFIDEIDKICSHGESRSSADASAEGVQRDLLPLIEGSVVNTKHGNVNTNHILFITSGAFHTAEPADLLPELQGRLPIRVELDPLTEADMYRILTEPQASLVAQQVELLRTEGLELQFEEDAIREMARVAAEVNQVVENIGARRLHTIMERIMEEISFHAPEMVDAFKEERAIEGLDIEYPLVRGESGAPTLVITKAIVEAKLAGLLEATNFDRFIL